MTENYLQYILPLIFLYAETHYRFRYFFSWLRKHEPEIIADIPSRTESGKNFPLLLIIKDAHQYPVIIKNITVTCNDLILIKKDVNLSVAVPYLEKFYEIATDEFVSGEHHINVRIQYVIKDKKKVCYNDNHRNTSHKPLPIYVSDSPLPRIEHARLGETHAHTIYTSDQVEFGASVAATARMADSMGLDFYCATDHSYDMDDMPDNYLVNDPDHKKWHSFLNDVSHYNRNSDHFTVIPGEEVSIRNSQGRNVHCLVYNSNQFYPGSGDSGEKWLRWRCEYDLAQLAEQTDDNVRMFAAHPFEKPPVLQRIFIGRDIWKEKDCRDEKLAGLQIINGGPPNLVEQAKTQWIKLLLQGHRIIAIAGNDAHGNFARFRQVGFPFFTMREHYHHLFGKWFTGVYLQDGMGGINALLQQLAAGECYMSNGPAVKFCAADPKSVRIPKGKAIINPQRLIIQAKSSAEFGGLKSITIYFGKKHDLKEQVIFSQISENLMYDFLTEIDTPAGNNPGYYRCEIDTVKGFQALSNPVWIELAE